MSWEEAQKWEASWWGNCVNTYGEETKQFQYAKRMGLRKLSDSQGPFFMLAGASVLDVGGGAVSLLLKCRDRGQRIVADPCAYPDWIMARYSEAAIECLKIKGEDLDLGETFDEVWIYNVLQHVADPQKVARNCLKHGKIVRVFEWLEIGVGAGHPHNLIENDLNDWFRGEGKVVPASRGKEYFGIFVGDQYE